MKIKEHTYDTAQPRISVSQMHVETAGERELGQVEAMGEALFFLTIGYRVSIAEWDGKRYVNRCNYYPGDL